MIQKAYYTKWLLELTEKNEYEVTTCICLVDGKTIFISQPSRKISKGFDTVFIVRK